MMNPSRTLCFSTSLLLCLTCGCASTGFLKLGKEDFPKAGPNNPVTQVMAIWQPANGVGLEGRTCRGFGGHVFFITHSSPIPAVVDGEVVVWLFDDQGTPEENSKPIHKFKFDAESWRHHARKGSLGPTYPIFIPYTKKGSHGATCNLMVSFTPREGATVNSEMVSMDLPGTKPNGNPPENTTESGSLSLNPVRQDGAGGEQRTPVATDGGAPERHRQSGPSRQAERLAAAEQAARMQLERSSEPRRLSPDEEQRIIREARARFATVTQPRSELSVKDYFPEKHRPLRNPLDEEAEGDSDE